MNLVGKVNQLLSFTFHFRGRFFFYKCPSPIRKISNGLGAQHLATFHEKKENFDHHDR